MTKIQKLLVKKIKENGPMDMGSYMELCLTHPKYGYYKTRDPLGEQGDFITSPEISQIFGELVGAFFADLWIKAGQPDKVYLLECGPGRGTLLQDFLRGTKHVPGFHDALDIILWETNPVLIKKQKNLLEDYPVRWVENLADMGLEKDGPLFFLANEFFDALPVRQYKKIDGEWFENCVSLDEDDNLVQTLISSGRQDDMPVGLSDGAICEKSPIRTRLAEKLFKILNLQGGAGLIIDYGYEMGCGDTLQAVQGHKFVDILHEPGEADLTAHVNFRRLIQLANSVELQTHGCVSQGAFLKRLGLHERAASLKKAASETQRIQIGHTVERLSADEQMGRLFKVLCVTAEYNERLLKPEGFR